MSGKTRLVIIGLVVATTIGGSAGDTIGDVIVIPGDAAPCGLSAL